MMITMVAESLESVRDKIGSGRLEEARVALSAVEETDENRTAVLFLRGYLAEREYERERALELYRAVLEQDPDHTEAAFRAALICDRYGDDESAIALYEQCTTGESAPVNALINLAVLYEDRGELDRASAALRDILETYPNHFRARHFLKSVESSYTMTFDERLLKDRDRRSAILDLPISDFELSVRSRNCLRQMNIRTLGDLLRTTEEQLMTYKNFGDTSLTEVKELLEQKGLRLGQALEPPPPPPPPPVIIPPPQIPTPDPSVHANRPVAELELSVRSRKALQRLGIVTIGDLAQRTEAELMTVKNFGQTSLAEVRRELEKFGLSLRQAKK